MFEILLALLAGAILPFQIGINGTLRNALGTPILASLTSFFVGTCALGIAALAMRTPWPQLSAQQWTTPLWMWSGGVLGAVYVFLSVFLAGKISATTLVSCIIAGQLSASLLVDHFGWFGFPQHSISLGRVAGVLLFGAGVWMLKRF